MPEVLEKKEEEISMFIDAPIWDKKVEQDWMKLKDWIEANGGQLISTSVYYRYKISFRPVK